MAKPTKINQVLAHIETLFKADRNVRISAMSLRKHFGFDCAAIVLELAGRGVLKFECQIKAAKSKPFVYTVNPDADFTPAVQFNPAEWQRMTRIKEQQAMQRGVALHKILFGAWGRHEVV
jgi:hypothetical protein